mmetsp:Transcript_19785/g.42937  ORF Transcript_19785/g.42937 Transcript_19785/m.42937 type:complete len:286 (-) Transcript_19785:999-1856(-)
MNLAVDSMILLSFGERKLLRLLLLLLVLLRCSFSSASRAAGRRNRSGIEGNSDHPYSHDSFQHIDKVGHCKNKGGRLSQLLANLLGFLSSCHCQIKPEAARSQLEGADSRSQTRSQRSLVVLGLLGWLLRRRGGSLWRFPCSKMVVFGGLFDWELRYQSRCCGCLRPPSQEFLPPSSWTLKRAGRVRKMMSRESVGGQPLVEALARARTTVAPKGLKRQFQPHPKKPQKPQKSQKFQKFLESPNFQNLQNFPNLLRDVYLRGGWGALTALVWLHVACVPAALHSR